MGDELALTPHEADTEAVVLGALEGLEGLVLGQGTVEPLWAPEVEGHVDGVALDLDALRRHWAALKVGEGQVWGILGPPRWHRARSPCTGASDQRPWSSSLCACRLHWRPWPWR